MNYQKIRSARKKAKKSQDDLANILGVNRATVSKYETGIIEPSVSQLIQISKYLGVDFREFLDDVEVQFYDAYRFGFDAGVRAEEIDSLALHSVMYDDGYRFTDAEVRLVNAFSQLNEEGQRLTVKYAAALASDPVYQNKEALDATNIQD